MAWRDSVTIEQLLAFLNEALTADPEAITKLFNTRVACNDTILNHETIQAGHGDPETGRVLDSGGVPVVGILGLLNGLFGIKRGWGRIAMNQDDSGKITEFLEVPQEMIDKHGVDI